MEKAFYVYTHARPDGSVFYIGKGSGRRAYDFAPRRRRTHHLNIVKKHGREAIIIRLYPCPSEPAAFALEREMIGEYLIAGLPLINLTLGGEGASGRKPNVRSLEAFKKCYGPGRVLTDNGRKAMAAAMTKVSAAWINSDAGQAHTLSLGMKSAAATAARKPWAITCQRCGALRVVKSPKAKYCAPCGQNGARREKPKAAPKPRGPQSESGKRKVSDAQRARWERMSEADREAWKLKMRNMNGSSRKYQGRLPSEVQAASGERRPL